MPRKRTASFILELPLKTDPGDERACAIILDAGRNIGNAVLGEGLRRLDLMRESRAYGCCSEDVALGMVERWPFCQRREPQRAAKHRGTMAKRLSMEAPRFSEGRLHQPVSASGGLNA
jgi:hypothetical protein